MFYKVKLNNEIVDALDSLQRVFYFPFAKMIMRCGKNDIAQGIISSDQKNIWHVAGWPDLNGDYSTVEIIEIEEAEYKDLRSILDEGKIPEDVETDQEPEPSVDELEWAKATKVAASKKMLAAYLESHPLSSNVHGGYTGTYSVTEEKQNLMSMNYATYMIKKNAGLDPVLTWNQTGEECEVWTEEEFLMLIVQVEAYIKPLVAAQQHYESAIKKATTLKEVAELEINYENNL